MANHNVTLTHTQPLPPSAQIFGLLPSLFYSFLCNTRLFSLGGELPQQTISLISAPIPLSLGLSVINSLSLSPFSLSVLSAYITALVLLRISSAGFEAISVHDHYQTRPEEKVGGEKRKTDEEIVRRREIKSKKTKKNWSTAAQKRKRQIKKISS